MTGLERWLGRSWRHGAAVAGLVAAIGVVRWYLNPNDDGFTLAPAWQVSQGLQPYRDFFEFHTPGAFYLFGWLFRVVGPSYTAARLLLFFLTLPAAWVVDWLTRQFTTGPWQRVAVLATWLVLVWQFSAISYHAVAHLAAIGAVAALVRAVSAGRPSVGRLAMAGMMVGLTGMLLQTAGFVLGLAGFLVAISARRLAALVAYLGGGALAVLPLAAWPLPLLWQHLVVNPLIWYPAANLAFDQPTWLVVTMAVVGALGLWAWLVQVQTPGFWALWLAAIALPLSVWPHSLIGYLASVVWPLPLLLFAVSPSRWQRPLPPAVRAWAARTWAALLTTCAVLVVSLGTLSVAFFFALFPRDDPLALRVPFWEDLAAVVTSRTAPNEPIFAVPHLTALYFYAQRPNATRHNSLQTEDHPPVFQDEIIADLKRVRPRLVIWERGGRLERRGQYQPGNRVEAYLDQRYRLAEELPRFVPRRIQLWERRPAGGQAP